MRGDWRTQLPGHKKTKTLAIATWQTWLVLFNELTSICIASLVYSMVHHDGVIVAKPGTPDTRMLPPPCPSSHDASTQAHVQLTAYPSTPFCNSCSLHGNAACAHIHQDTVAASNLLVSTSLSDIHSWPLLCQPNNLPTVVH